MEQTLREGQGPQPAGYIGMGLVKANTFAEGRREAIRIHNADLSLGYQFHGQKRSFSGDAPLTCISKPWAQPTRS